jgi:acetyltransferase-like isoleucine patch superfamily enzyme
VFIKMIRIARESWAARFHPIDFARSIGVQVGEGCRLLGVDRETFGSEPYLIRLGNHVSTTDGVRFVTHDGGVWVFREDHPDIDVVAPIVVGNNVFIGLNTVILAGVTIGDDCVIGAGSVVSRDIPSGSVAAGCPAKPIREIGAYRDGILEKAIYIRSLAPEQKRADLEKRFRDVLRPGS